MTLLPVVIMQSLSGTRSTSSETTVEYVADELNLIDTRARRVHVLQAGALEPPALNECVA